MTTPLRERSREILRAELAEAAFDYFAARDFDAVTVDEVAHAIGISRASFFRYFGSKEDAVVEAVYAAHVDFPKILAAQPEEMRSDPWLRLRRMFTPSIAPADERPDALRSRIRLIDSAPGLRARLNERRWGQRAGVAEELVSDDVDLRTARALVAGAFAIIDLAWSEWMTEPGSSLSEIADQLFTMMEPSAISLRR